MASPVADSYAVDSGSSVWAGRYPSYGALAGVATLGGIAAGGTIAGLEIPSWVSAQPSQTFGVIPFTNSLADLNPKNNPAINPVYPSTPEWMGNHIAIVGAWCGACYDWITDTWWLPLQGGHADYAGNEPYRALLMQEAPEWTMVRWPSGAIGNLLTTNDGNEASGVYSDGQPRAIHSYNRPVWIPGKGPCIPVLGKTSWASNTSTPVFVSIDPDTGNGTLETGDNPSPGEVSGAGACYDESRHAVWFRGAGTGSFTKRDITAQTWSVVGSTKSVSSYSSVCRLPDDDCLLWGNAHLTQGFAVFDCVTGTLHEPTFSGSLAGGCRPGYTQWHWVPSLGACIGWDNSSDTTLITRLTPGANPRTDTWTMDTLPVDGANAVTPDVRATNGTYGRFQYSPRMGIAMFFNSTSGPHYFYKL